MKIYDVDKDKIITYLLIFIYVLYLILSIK
jgi:hypothetical protein